MQRRNVKKAERKQTGGQLQSKQTFQLKTTSRLILSLGVPLLIVDCRSPWTCHHSLAVVFDRIPKDSKQSEICHEIHHSVL